MGVPLRATGPLGDSVRSAVRELDIKSSTNTRKVNFANFNNNVDLNTYIPTFTRNHRGDSPELDQLNHAIDQVRLNTLKLEDRRNSLNEKVSRREKKKREKQEKRERKERKERKRRAREAAAAAAAGGEGGGGEGGGAGGSSKAAWPGRKKRLSFAECPVEYPASPRHSPSPDEPHRRHTSLPPLPRVPLSAPPCPNPNGEKPSTEDSLTSECEASGTTQPTTQSNNTETTSEATQQEQTSTKPDMADQEESAPVPPQEEEEGLVGEEEEQQPPQPQQQQQQQQQQQPPPPPTPPQAEPEVEREPPVVFKEDLDVSTEDRQGGGGGGRTSTGGAWKVGGDGGEVGGGGGDGDENVGSRKVGAVMKVCKRDGVGGAGKGDRSSLGIGQKTNSTNRLASNIVSGCWERGGDGKNGGGGEGGGDNWKGINSDRTHDRKDCGDHYYDGESFKKGCCDVDSKCRESDGVGCNDGSVNSQCRECVCEKKVDSGRKIGRKLKSVDRFDRKVRSGSRHNVLKRENSARHFECSDKEGLVDKKGGDINRNESSVFKKGSGVNKKAGNVRNDSNVDKKVCDAGRKGGKIGRSGSNINRKVGLRSRQKEDKLDRSDSNFEELRCLVGRIEIAVGKSDSNVGNVDSGIGCSSGRKVGHIVRKNYRDDDKNIKVDENENPISVVDSGVVERVTDDFSGVVQISDDISGVGQTADSGVASKNTDDPTIAGKIVEASSTMGRTIDDLGDISWAVDDSGAVDVSSAVGVREWPLPCPPGSPTSPPASRSSSPCDSLASSSSASSLSSYSCSSPGYYYQFTSPSSSSSSSSSSSLLYDYDSDSSVSSYTSSYSYISSSSSSSSSSSCSSSHSFTTSSKSEDSDFNNNVSDSSQANLLTHTTPTPPSPPQKNPIPYSPFSEPEIHLTAIQSNPITGSITPSKYPLLIGPQFNSNSKKTVTCSHSPPSTSNSMTNHMTAQKDPPIFDGTSKSVYKKTLTNPQSPASISNINPTGAQVITNPFPPFPPNLNQALNSSSVAQPNKLQLSPAKPPPPPHTHHQSQSCSTPSLPHISHSQSTPPQDNHTSRSLLSSPPQTKATLSLPSPGSHSPSNTNQTPQSSSRVSPQTSPTSSTSTEQSQHSPQAPPTPQKLPKTQPQASSTSTSSAIQAKPSTRAPPSYPKQSQPSSPAFTYTNQLQPPRAPPPYTSLVQPSSAPPTSTKQSQPSSVLPTTSTNQSQPCTIVLPPYRDPPPYTAPSHPLPQDSQTDPSSLSSFSDLSRSSTAASDISMSSTTSAMSFGSSYYFLYMVDPIGRVPTPEELPSSPETSPCNSPHPSPPLSPVLNNQLNRCDSDVSICSVDTLRTVTPDQEYFEENDAAFRRMHGISSSGSPSGYSSYGSCLSRRSRSRSLSYDSSSTLQLRSHSPSPSLPGTPVLDSPTSTSPSPTTTPTPAQPTTTRSQPTSPVLPRMCGVSRAYSLESISSFLRGIPRAPSSFASISTFELAPSSSRTSPLPHPEPPVDRPPSTDSLILLESPIGAADESVVIYRPVPRYGQTHSDSPPPRPALLCHLGPTHPNRELPLIYSISDKQARAEFDGLVGACGQMLNPEEQAHMEELRAYVVEDEGSWALGENFSILFTRILHDPTIPDQARLHLVRIMAAAALKDDVILLLHQDRRDHTIMNYANRVESLPPPHQEALALFFCNMFEHLSPSEWLLYISEWQDGGQQASNIRVTTKIAVNALLHSDPKVQEYGTAIMYNLGTKEVKTVVFDDVAPELAMAILQFFSTHPPEELLWRTMTALCRFCYSSTEVPALIKMIGPEPSTFKGSSERIDSLIEEIDAKLSRVRLF
ncbi:hypothetical protein Pmani_011627 [Petrolisthes manimaculis]|uniref:Uncharacterized protein n=1 Tax=Petrolisthes manimaculis TaxID=1843537 RepID=A0AAE1Q0R0_9EUCA|nr:hypothetical protein Pmani_011627 [Petrolisthes manimaculis]